MMESINVVLQTVTAALSALRAAKDLIPAGPEREAATKAIDDAENAVKIAEAQAANSMGYALCRCTWPPQIMLESKDNVRSCSACGRSGTPAELTGPVVVDSGSSWLDARR